MKANHVKIELKKLKLYPALSEETQAYSAAIFLDGRHIADVHNDGHGAADNVMPKAPFTYDQLLALEKRIAAEHPPLKSSITGEDLPYTLEMLCGDLIHRAGVERRLARAMKSKIVAIIDGGLSEFSFKGVKAPSPALRAQLTPAILRKHPTAKLLNTLPLEEAVDAVLAASK